MDFYNFLYENFELSKYIRQVDYAPVNEPIEGDDFGELPEEKQPDYVPNEYETGTPKDDCSTCEESFIIDFI